MEKRLLWSLVLRSNPAQYTHMSLLTVQLLSDLHFEFHHDGGEAFVQSLDPTGVDVLVLAGDIGLVKGGSLARGLQLLAARYAPRPLLFVLGNHEYYGSTRDAVRERMHKLEDELPQLHWLENRSVTILGQRFVGTTLWFPDQPDNATYAGTLSDFLVIKDFHTWNYPACVEAQAFLEQTVQAGDVVITHHLPTHAAVHPRWQAPAYREFNRFFVCPVSQELLSRPTHWFFGHTHDSYINAEKGTIVCCNPLGYPDEINDGFDAALHLQVGCNAP